MDWRFIGIEIMQIFDEVARRDSAVQRGDLLWLVTVPGQFLAGISKINEYIWQSAGTRYV